MNKPKTSKKVFAWFLSLALMVSFCAPVTVLAGGVTTAVIKGIPKVGGVLTAETDGVDPLNYEWRITSGNSSTGGTVVSTTSEKYSPISSDKGQYIYVIISGNDGTSATSPTVGPVEAADVGVTTATLTGTAKVGETLAAAANTGATTPLSYQWYRSGDGTATGGTLIGTNQAAYTLVAADYDKHIYVTISGVKGSQATSNVLGPVLAVDVSAATISGTPKVGEALTAAANSDATPPLKYEWYSNTTNSTAGGTPVGTDQATYIPVAADFDKYIYVTITGVNGSSTTSAVLGPVAAADVGVTSATITGTAKVGETLTAAANSDATLPLKYEWYRSENGTVTGSDTPVGTDQNTYIPVAADAGKHIYVTISGANGSSITSAVLGPVAVADVEVSSATITGATIVGETLTAAANPDATGTLSYQWYTNTSNTNSGGTAVGLDQNTYSPVAADVTKYIYVTITGHNGVAKTSTAVGPVTAATQASTAKKVLEDNAYNDVEVEWDTDASTTLATALDAVKAQVGSVAITDATVGAIDYQNAPNPTAAGITKAPYNFDVAVDGDTDGSSTTAVISVNITFKPEVQPTYGIKIGDFANGKVTAGKAEAEAGETITLTITPDKGYQLKAGSLKVTGSDGKAVDVADNKFTMPACEVTVTAEFEKAPGETVTGVKLSQNAATLNKGDTLQLTAAVQPGNATGKTVAWSTSSDAVATVSSTGLVTAKAIGTATITATAGGKTAACTVKVVAPVTHIAVSQRNIHMVKKNTANLQITAYTKDNSKPKLTWESSRPGIATVNQNGKVTALAAGKTTVTVTAENGISTYINIQVVNKAKPAKGLYVSGAGNRTIRVGRTSRLAAVVSPAKFTGNPVRWRSSNPSVLHIDEAGRITGLKPGKVTVTAVAGGKKATTKLTVLAPAPKKVAMSKASISLKEGKSYKLRIAVSPKGADATGKWKSSNTKVAAVNASGRVTARGAGKATITFTSTTGKTVRCVVRVK